MNKPAIYERACAKVNLALDITGRRADGYHLLDMVCQTVSLFDDIYINVNAGDVITLTRTEGGDRGIALPAGEDNLMYRAASLMRKTYGITRGVDISFTKRIPAEAGLGGGSADAAAVMRAMNRLFELGAAAEELEEIGISLGADVPYFIRGGAQRVRGIGERLDMLGAPGDIYILVAKPSFGMSTAAVYAAYDEIPPEDIIHPDIERLISDGSALDVRNVLEYPASARAPLIKELKAAIASARGALAAAMTGSGSAVFGLFADPDSCAMAAASLSASALAASLAGVYCLTPVDTIDREEICDT